MVDAALIAVLGLDHAGAVGVIVAGEDLGAEFQAGAAAYGFVTVDPVFLGCFGRGPGGKGSASNRLTL
jgi:hypothetical protein